MKRRTLLTNLALLTLTESVVRGIGIRLPGLCCDATNKDPHYPLVGSGNEPLSSAASVPIRNSDMIGVNAFRAEWLPVFRHGMTTHQFCSYDRAGDNYDAEYLSLYKESNGECVIFDAMGPGCLYRHHMNLWHTREIEKGISIRYYFDDEAKPRIDMDISTFFSAANPLGLSKAPLAYDGMKRFRVMYHPMFFKRRLKVCLSAEPGGPGTVPMPWTGRESALPNRRNHWYQYTYQLFSEDPGLDSWTPETGRAMIPALLALLNPERLGSDLKPAQGARREAATCKVAAGQTAVLWKKAGRSGSIASLRIKLDTAGNADALFNTWLRITFDNAPAPQIEAPLGCFFGAYRTSPESSYTSLLLGYSNGAGYCAFPMPFWKSAAIHLDNRSRHEVPVVASVDYKPASAIDYSQQHCGHLYARYRREDPRTEGRDYKYLEVSGSGQVVGHVVSRWNTCMEEDERTYFDGSRTPWIYGDGFEDDHDMGWGLQNLSEPLFGAVDAKGGDGGIYRFLLADMYAFSNGISYGHQTYGPHSPLGYEGNYHVGTEESVVFWYGSPTPRLIQTDEVDVGNPASEATHAYHAEGDVQRIEGNYWYDGEYNNVLFKTAPIADTGVSFTRRSTFTVTISPGNRGVRLRRRCDKENNRQEARVFIDGRLVTERHWYSVDFEQTYHGIRWFDSDFDLPANYTKGKNKISVTIEFVGSETGRWDEFHYWAFCYSG